MRLAGMVLLSAGGGMLVAGGVVALIVGLGIITRFVGISHTAYCNELYETMVVLGAVFGNALTVYQMPVPFGRFGLMVTGLFAGVFVGGWIMALAEVIRIFPIFSRRIGLTKGISWTVLAVAFGKMSGSIVHFYFRW